VPAQRVWSSADTRQGASDGDDVRNRLDGARNVADAIVGGVSISGVFDLEPLVDVSFNSDLRLNRRSAREVSPVHLEPLLEAPLLLAAGADETSEFIRQSRSLWERWPRCRPRAREGPLFVAGKHHFSVLTEFADPQSELFATTMGMFESG
jgi:arylformamidase